MIPGEYLLASEPITLNADKKTETVSVVNTGDRPVQIGSHFHFFEVNRQLEFNRLKAYGMRLNIAAGTAVRFEPGEAKTVALVTIGGAQKIWGFNNLVDGDLDTNEHGLLKKLEENNFKHKE